MFRFKNLQKMQKDNFSVLINLVNTIPLELTLVNFDKLDPLKNETPTSTYS